jgi:predicted MFS family arabinose efflux permease
MHLEPYRRVLALPGVRSLIVVALLARIPPIAAGFALTLHVVIDMHRGYGAAGLVGTASTIGAALGGPALGRFVDRRGLRPVLVLTTVAEAVFWATVPVQPYAVMLLAAFVAGLVSLPVFSVVRQSLAALVPEAQRRPAYSMDSMSVELSFMVAPALAVFLATTISTTVALAAVGMGFVLAGVGLYLLNPPIREAEHDDVPTVAVPVRSWLRPALIGLLVITAGATLVLGGTDVAMVAILRGAGEVKWVGLVAAAWGLYSMAGGFVYGAVRRPLSPLTLMVLLGAFTLPVGLGGNWWALCLLLIPAGALCAPTLAATADAVSRLVPASARGEAMGWYGSALTVGMAAGAPMVGVVVDRSGPMWGPAAAGAVGLALALVAFALKVLPSRRSTPVGADEHRAPSVVDDPVPARVPDELLR